MQLLLILILFMPVPEISGGFHAEICVSVIIRCVIHCEFSLPFPLKVHFCGGIQEQRDLCNKLPLSVMQSIFLMLIMWHAAPHHRSQCNLFFCSKPVRAMNAQRGRRSTAHFHITTCYIFICTVKMVGRYKIEFHWDLAG